MAGRTWSDLRAALVVPALVAHCAGCGSHSGLDGVYVLPGSGGASFADAGSSSTGGTGGVSPSDSGTRSDWTSAGELFACRVERLEEPADRSTFLWEPCEADPTCERAHFAPSVLEEGPSKKTGSRLTGGDVHDDGRLAQPKRSCEASGENGARAACEPTARFSYPKGLGGHSLAVLRSWLPSYFFAIRLRYQRRRLDDLLLAALDPASNAEDPKLHHQSSHQRM